MAGYTRQSTFADGDTITAALFNNEYNQVLNAFSNSSGHKHDGTAAEGPVIGLIGDAGLTTPLNKVLIQVALLLKTTIFIVGICYSFMTKKY